MWKHGESLRVFPIGFLGLTLTASGEPFWLREEATGKVYGPFDATHGTSIVVGTNVFTVIRTSDRRSVRRVEPSLEQKLAHTIIPEINFREADIRDVIEYLRQASEEYSPYTEAQHRGVNLIVTRDDTGAEPTGRITFRAQRLSLGEALKAVLSVANLEYEVRNNWILIRRRPPKTP